MTNSPSFITQSSFLSPEELKNVGFKSYGDEVLVSRFARIYHPELVQLGNRVRIDDFSVISGTLVCGDGVHIGAFSALFGLAGIELGDYAGLSPRVSVFSASDDFSGAHLVGPMVDPDFRLLQSGKVVFKKWVQVGASSVVLPNICLEEGVAIGALSLVKTSLPPFTIWAGNPLRFLKNRSRDLTTLSAHNSDPI